MQLPGPVRAIVGLLAATAEEAKHLPDRAIELPMLAVSSALQMSLRAQQRYARLAARGDDVINRRPASDEPPSWATFDDPVSANDLRVTGLDDADPALRARAASQLLDELLGGVEGSPPARLRSAPEPPEPPEPAEPSEPGRRSTRTPTKKQPAAKKQAAAKQPAANSAPVKKTAAKSAPVKMTAAKRPAAKKAGGPA
ncbi:MAG: hypothetical protein QOI15_2792, partial [Pseudonocardiales bacterium]|nr:hypothetical protein [Pseudonocardiales bacterium]